MNKEPQEKLNIFKRHRLLPAAVLCLIIVVAAATGITTAWYRSTNGSNPKMSGVSSAGVNEMAVGHDTYKFQYDSGDNRQSEGWGIKLPLNSFVTMNTYDKVFASRNTRTPIILRAVLSSQFAEKAPSGSIKLAVDCGSDSFMRDGLDMNNDWFKDSGDPDVEDVVRYLSGTSKGALYIPSGASEGIRKSDHSSYSGTDANGTYGYDGITDYLSNIVNLRAAYCPGIVDNEPYATSGDSSIDLYWESGSYNYVDADDYVYRQAVGYFNSNTGIQPVKFVQETTVTRELPTITTTRQSITRVMTSSDMSASAGSNVAITTGDYAGGSLTTSYNLEGYLLAYNDGGTIKYMRMQDSEDIHLSFSTTNVSEAIGSNNTGLWHFSLGNTAISTNGTYIGYESCTGNDILGKANEPIDDVKIRNTNSDIWTVELSNGLLNINHNYQIQYRATSGSNRYNRFSINSALCFIAEEDESDVYYYGGIYTHFNRARGSSNYPSYPDYPSSSSIPGKAANLDEYDISVSPDFWLYKVETITETKNPPLPITSDVMAKTILIDVDLNQAQASDGNYYVYLMIDYDRELVDAYALANNLSFMVGSHDNTVVFEDYFDITVVDTSTE